MENIESYFDDDDDDDDQKDVQNVQRGDSTGSSDQTQPVKNSLAQQTLQTQNHETQQNNIQQYSQNFQQVSVNQQDSQLQSQQKVKEMNSASTASASTEVRKQKSVFQAEFDDSSDEEYSKPEQQHELPVNQDKQKNQRQVSYFEYLTKPPEVSRPRLNSQPIAQAITQNFAKQLLVSGQVSNASTQESAEHRQLQQKDIKIHESNEFFNDEQQQQEYDIEFNEFLRELEQVADFKTEQEMEQEQNFMQLSEIRKSISAEQKIKAQQGSSQTYQPEAQLLAQNRSQNFKQQQNFGNFRNSLTNNQMGNSQPLGGESKRGSIFRVWTNMNQPKQGITIEITGIEKYKKNMQTHWIFTIEGIDKIGQFQVKRNISQFFAMKKAMEAVFPGCFVPPLPDKSQIEDQQISDELKMKLMGIFVMQVARRQHLYRSPIFQHFLRSEVEHGLSKKYAEKQKLEKEITLEKLQKLQQTYARFFGKLNRLRISAEKQKDLKLFHDVVDIEIQTLKTLKMPKFDSKDQQAKEQFKTQECMINTALRSAESMLIAFEARNIFEEHLDKLQEKLAKKQEELNECNTGTRSIKYILFSGSNEELSAMLAREVQTIHQNINYCKVIDTVMLAIHIFYEMPKYLQIQGELYKQIMAAMEQLQIQNIKTNQQLVVLKDKLSTLQRLLLHGEDI